MQSGAGGKAQQTSSRAQNTDTTQLGPINVLADRAINVGKKSRPSSGAGESPGLVSMFALLVMMRDHPTGLGFYGWPLMKTECGKY